MKCANHPEVEALGVCSNYDKAVCSECQVEVHKTC